MTIDELDMQAVTMGVRVDYRPLPHGLMGLYDLQKSMIIIDSSLSERQTRSTLTHELVHAEYMDQGCSSVLGSRAELRARRLTALRLIQPEDYRQAEEAYEGNKYLMAKDLDVTVQVLEDYQKILMEGAHKNE